MEVNHKIWYLLNRLKVSFVFNALLQVSKKNCVNFWILIFFRSQEKGHILDTIHTPQLSQKGNENCSPTCEYCAKSDTICSNSVSPHIGFYHLLQTGQSKNVVIFTQDVGQLHHYVPLLASFLLLLESTPFFFHLKKCWLEKLGQWTSA